MRSKEPIPKNHIDELLAKKGLQANQLAEMIGVSTSYMSKLINHLAPVSTKLADKIGQALEVDPNKVVDLPFSRKFMATCDEALLGSALGWLLEAAEQHKLELSHQELSRWASYVYKSALEAKLNMQQTKYFATAVVEIIKKT